MKCVHPSCQIGYVQTPAKTLENIQLSNHLVFTQLQIQWKCQRMDIRSQKLDSCTYPSVGYRRDRVGSKTTRKQLENN
jgi:hypothetical protein